MLYHERIRVNLTYLSDMRWYTPPLIRYWLMFLYEFYFSNLLMPMARRVCSMFSKRYMVGRSWYSAGVM